MTEPARFRVVRHGEDGRGAPVDDWISVEEPLEIRLAGDTYAVTMRTPGHDPELAAGFLLSEGLVASRSDLGSLRHCGDPDSEGYGNVLDVLPAPGFAFELPETNPGRRTRVSAACGVCGRRTIDDLLERAKPLDDGSPIAARTIHALADQLVGEQAHFSKTGSLHAAALSDTSGQFRVVREDIGRHNAVDKVLGRLLFDAALGEPGRLLVVSGRSSFEIVQKAAVAGIAAVVSVSAPSSLAIETAARMNIALVGFARSGRFNVYHGAERIVD